MKLSTTKKLSSDPRYSLNAVCPYYTMFPLEFPLQVLKQMKKNTIVLDPFCGRGTTNYAAQVLGIKSYGIDTSTIAVAITKAKLAKTTFSDVIALADEFLNKNNNVEVPKGSFWRWAFHPETLVKVCQLKEGLLGCENTDSAIMLRAIALGCLHGPMNKDANNPSYFSNQMPRTFAPKPDYSVKFWKKNDLKPSPVDLIQPIKKKAKRILDQPIQQNSAHNCVFRSDSKNYDIFLKIKEKIHLVVTSPPYYGMKRYIQDQWLRNWFLGGSQTIDYHVTDQLDHFSPDLFAKSLSKVWDNIYNIAADEIRLVVRFGGMPSRKVNYDDILKTSLDYSAANWRIYYRRNAGNAGKGRRQANIMGGRVKSSPINETDYYIRLD